MGVMPRQASREQRDEFVEKFKRSCLRAYARALVESRKTFAVEVLRRYV